MADPNRMAIEAIREHYEQAVARAELMDQLRAVAVERANNESTRAEAAEAELREERKASEAWEDAFKKAHANYAMTAEQLFQLRRVVDAWKSADKGWSGTSAAMTAFREAEEALRHA